MSTANFEEGGGGGRGKRGGGGEGGREGEGDGDGEGEGTLVGKLEKFSRWKAWVKPFAPLSPSCLFTPH